MRAACNFEPRHGESRPGKRVTSSRGRAERSTRGNVIYNPGPDTFTVTSTSDGMVSSMDNWRSEELGAGLQMGAALRNALDEQTQWRHSGFQQRGSLGVTTKPQEGISSASGSKRYDVIIRDYLLPFGEAMLVQNKSTDNKLIFISVTHDRKHPSGFLLEPNRTTNVRLPFFRVNDCSSSYVARSVYVDTDQLMTTGVSLWTPRVQCDSCTRQNYFVVFSKYWVYCLEFWTLALHLRPVRPRSMRLFAESENQEDARRREFRRCT